MPLALRASLLHRRSSDDRRGGVGREKVSGMKLQKNKESDRRLVAKLMATVVCLPSHAPPFFHDRIWVIAKVIPK